MSSALITVLLFGAVLLIITGFIVSVLLERRRNLQVLAHQRQIYPTTNRRTTVLLHPQDGLMVYAERLSQASPAASSSSWFQLPSSWYTRRGTLVSLSFLIMLLLTLFVQSGLADGALQNISRTFSFLSSSESTDYLTAAQLQAQAQGSSLTASQRIVRVDSAAENQYYNTYQWDVWSFSSCSGIAMEEVMNAYGKHLIAADVLQVEQNLGVWNTYSGLITGEKGIAEAAAYFGFKASPNPPRTLQALIAIANKGYPVIVGVPDHILVVRGGNNAYVYLVDSAPADQTIVTYAQFMSEWNNFSVVLTPA
ncbi:MAG: cysteine peptidase family C39 domain-containing protein [Ktedonobacteraceae bacterium]